MQENKEAFNTPFRVPCTNQDELVQLFNTMVMSSF